MKFHRFVTGIAKCRCVLILLRLEVCHSAVHAWHRYSIAEISHVQKECVFP